MQQEFIMIFFFSFATQRIVHKTMKIKCGNYFYTNHKKIIYCLLHMKCTLSQAHHGLEEVQRTNKFVLCWCYDAALRLLLATRIYLESSFLFHELKSICRQQFLGNQHWRSERFNFFPWEIIEDIKNARRVVSRSAFVVDASCFSLSAAGLDRMECFKHKQRVAMLE